MKIYIYIYIAVLCIALALFISCDEKKAKDEIKKALDKKVDVADKSTPKPTNAGTTPQGSGRPTNTESEEAGGDTPPPPSPKLFVVSSYRVQVGQAATFTKLPGYTYALKTPTINVILSDVEGDATKKQVSATEVVSGVVVVGTKDGNTIESEPIEFFLNELTKPVLSALRVRKETAITFPKVVEHTYALKDPANFLTLDVSDENTGQVRATKVASGVIVVATFDGNSIDSDPIDFLFYVADKPALEAEIKKRLDAEGATADLNYIDTSDITDMSSLFQGNTNFNGDISKWNTSKVENMSYMLRATAFNKPLNNWDVSSVTDMTAMFYGASAFNKPLNNWNVSSVEYMSHMFSEATAFNQDLSGWVDKSGRHKSRMFSGATVMQTSNKPSWAR